MKTWKELAEEVGKHYLLVNHDRCSCGQKFTDYNSIPEWRTHIGGIILKEEHGNSAGASTQKDSPG